MDTQNRATIRYK